jgi:hypothetical protein
VGDAAHAAAAELPRPSLHPFLARQKESRLFPLCAQHSCQLLVL